MDIGPIIKERRTRLKLSQQDLAEFAEVGIATIKDIERGKGNPSLQTLQKILNVLGIPLRFYDLRGIENEETLNYYVNIMSKYNGKDVNSSDNINAIFYTMDYKKEGTIIEKMEEKIFEQLVKFERPILFIITKYPYPPNEIINIKDSQKSAREDGKKNL